MAVLKITLVAFLVFSDENARPVVTVARGTAFGEVVGDVGFDDFSFGGFGRSRGSCRSLGGGFINAAVV